MRKLGEFHGYCGCNNLCQYGEPCPAAHVKELLSTEDGVPATVAQGQVRDPTPSDREQLAELGLTVLELSPIFNWRVKQCRH